MLHFDNSQDSVWYILPAILYVDFGLALTGEAGFVICLCTEVQKSCLPASCLRLDIAGAWHDAIPTLMAALLNIHLPVPAWRCQ